MLRRRNNWRAGMGPRIPPYEFMDSLQRTAVRYNGRRQFILSRGRRRMYFRSQLKLYRGNKSHVIVRQNEIAARPPRWRR